MRFQSAFASVVLSIALLTPPAAWAENATSLLNRWYMALERADDGAAASLLAPEATIALEDLGIVQSKAEFLNSFGDWSEAISGGSIRYKLDAASSGSATARVCYRFTENSMTTEERFQFSGGKITRSVQRELAANCEGF